MLVLNYLARVPARQRLDKRRQPRLPRSRNKLMDLCPMLRCRILIRPVAVSGQSKRLPSVPYASSGRLRHPIFERLGQLRSGRLSVWCVAPSRASPRECACFCTRNQRIALGDLGLSVRPQGLATRRRQLKFQIKSMLLTRYFEATTRLLREQDMPSLSRIGSVKVFGQQKSCENPLCRFPARGSVVLNGI